MKNSVLAGNTDSSGNAFDCTGVVRSEGHNVFGGVAGDGFCAIDVQGTDTVLADGEELGLGRLVADSTLGGLGYRVLDADSALVDGGDTTACSETDQVGQTRIGPCDIGAVEFSRTFQSTCQGLRAEGAQARLFGGFERNTVFPSTIGVAEGYGSRSAPDNNERASFCFDVRTAGLYQLSSRAFSQGPLSDSFFVRWDKFPEISYLWDLPRSIGRVSHRGGPDPVAFYLRPGETRFSVLLREDGTSLDNLRLEPLRAPARCAGLARAAREGDLFGNMATGGGGAFVSLPQGSGANNAPDARDRAAYCFEVIEAGRYSVVGTVQARDRLSDSFFVQIDGAPNRTYLWDIANTRVPRDVTVSDRTTGRAVMVDLQPGIHLVTLFAREDGTRLYGLRLNRVR